jgi:hypothetical protein
VLILFERKPVTLKRWYANKWKTRFYHFYLSSNNQLHQRLNESDFRSTHWCYCSCAKIKTGGFVFVIYEQGKKKKITDKKLRKTDKIAHYSTNGERCWYVNLTTDIFRLPTTGYTKVWRNIFIIRLGKTSGRKICADKDFVKKKSPAFARKALSI